MNGTRVAGTAGIVIIGDEILSAKVVDENARFVLEQLRGLGVKVARVVIIPDLLDEIAAAVRDASARFEHVFTSGGVGPTHDDLTMAGIARAFATTVIRDPQLEAMLRAHFAERLQPSHLRMAEVPSGAKLIAGDATTWPVVAMDNVYILPGVPEIFRRKFLAIAERFRVAPFFLRSVYTSDDEGNIAEHLNQIVRDFPAVQVGSYPRFDTRDYSVKITLEAKDAAAVDAATKNLAATLGKSVLRIA